MEFWYEFSSTYSHLSAMRIGELAANQGVDVRWRPFLLGPIFQAMGWDNSPFKIYPQKVRYMVRDIERIAEVSGLSFERPDPFPQNGLYAGRLALIGAEEGWGPAFTRAIYTAEFGADAFISDRGVLASALTKLGLDADNCFTKTGEAGVKERLKARTVQAQPKGIMGAPSFTIGEEVFWGDDRLEQALAWAQSH